MLPPLDCLELGAILTGQFHLAVGASFNKFAPLNCLCANITLVVAVAVSTFAVSLSTFAVYVSVSVCLCGHLYSCICTYTGTA